MTFYAQEHYNRVEQLNGSWAFGEWKPGISFKFNGGSKIIKEDKKQ